MMLAFFGAMKPQRVASRVAFFILAASAFGQTPPLRHSITAEERNLGYSQRTLLARPRAAVSAEQAAAAETREGRQVRRTFSRLGNLRVLEPAAGESATQAIERLRATGRYEFVEPDYIVTADAVPNDP